MADYGMSIVERDPPGWADFAAAAMMKHGFPIASIDDIVGSKQAANRQKDKESLPRLLSFREWLKKKERVRGTRAGRGPAPLNPPVLFGPVRQIA